MKLITAKEAFEAAKSIERVETDPNYINISGAILREVKKFGTHIWWYEFIPVHVQEKLKSLGYTISANQGRYNETLYKISWEQ